MAPYNPPVRNEAFLVRIALVRHGGPGAFKSSPTIAAGDFKVDKDGAGLSNLATLPSVSPAARCSCCSPSRSTEMDADVVTSSVWIRQVLKSGHDLVIIDPDDGMRHIVRRLVVVRYSPPKGPAPVTGARTLLRLRARGFGDRHPAASSRGT